MNSAQVGTTIAEVIGKADWMWDDELDMHIPACSQLRGGLRCGNGPLVGDQIRLGDCGQDHLQSHDAEEWDVWLDEGPPNFEAKGRTIEQAVFSIVQYRAGEGDLPIEIDELVARLGNWFDWVTRTDILSAVYVLVTGRKVDYDHATGIISLKNAAIV